MQSSILLSAAAPEDSQPRDQSQSGGRGHLLLQSAGNARLRRCAETEDARGEQGGCHHFRSERKRDGASRRSTVGPGLLMLLLMLRICPLLCLICCMNAS